jgi:S-adenosylmethionine synthetase
MRGPNGGNEGGESRVKMSQEIMRRGKAEKARGNNCLPADVVPPSATMAFEATAGREPTSFIAAIDAVAVYGFLQYCILNAPGTTLPKEGCYVLLMLWGIWIVNICDM